jgi:tRNA nucleotidyltransferase (CCA-adding enzyme)
VARAARGAPLEVVALAGGPNARRWIDELRHVRLEITGDDLLAAGVPEGPELGRRLAVALDRKLDEGLSGRDAELAAALG